MNTQELVAHVARELAISRTEAARVVTTVFDGVRTGLSADGKAKLGDLGNLVLRYVHPRKVYNPNTGAYLPVPGQNRVLFRPPRG